MGKKGLFAAFVDSSQLPEWDRLAAVHGCLFDSVRWTRLFEPRIRRVGLFDAGATLRGGFCVWQQRKLGLRILRNPPFTPHVGPFFEYRASNAAARTNEERDVMEAMAAWLDSQHAAVISLGLALTAKDCLPFYWRGFKVVPHWTYLVDLARDPETLLAAMSVDRRNEIRKADRDGLRVESVSDTTALRSLVHETFARNKKFLPHRVFDTLSAEFPPGRNSFCLLPCNEGVPVASVYVVHDEHTAYYLMGGYTDGAHHGAGALAMWHAILKAKELGLQVFDFEGSVIPPIERYFRGFGGTLTPVFSIHKAWLPLEMLLGAIPKYRNRF